MRAGLAITQEETIRERADNHRETEDTRDRSRFSIPSTPSTDLYSFGVWTWEFGLGSPDCGGRADGLYAFGTAAYLMTSPHQLFLFMSLLKLFTVNDFLQSTKYDNPAFFIILYI